MKTFFKSLLNYNQWANESVLNSVISGKISDEKMLSILNHIISAQILWYDRISGRGDNLIRPWHQFPLEKLSGEFLNNTNQWLKLLSSADEYFWNKEFAYKNSIGDSFKSSYTDVFTHVINHSSYHRGQIALRMRELGFNPVLTDYIVYQRSAAVD